MKMIAIVISALIYLYPVYSQQPASINAHYFGGSGEEYNSHVAIDAEGNIIIAGTTGTRNMSLKPENQISHGGGQHDGFVAKYNAKMDQLIFFTYLGASYAEVRGVETDSLNNIYVTGNAMINLPVTSNAYDKTYNGGFTDCFINKYNAEGTLLYSSYIGGSDGDFGNFIKVLNQDEILLYGFTGSTNFPVKPSQSVVNKGIFDVFIIKLNLSANNLVFSKTLGGSGMDFPGNIRTDGTGNIYISGSGSEGFPAVAGLKNQIGNGFISKLNQNGELIYSSKAFNGIVFIDINDHGEVYFTSGYSASDLPCSNNAFYTNHIGGDDIVLGKINSSGDSLLYLSYFGGSDDDRECFIHHVSDDKVVLVGETKSSDYPLSFDGENKDLAQKDIGISVLDLENKELVHSTFIGGSKDDEIWNSALAHDTTIYFCTTTQSRDFPMPSDSVNTRYKGNTDAVIVSMSLNQSTSYLSVSASDITLSETTGNTNSFTVSSNTLWSITASENWLTIDKERGINNTGIIVSADENQEPIQRMATLTISGDNVPSQIIHVTQEALTSNLTSSLSQQISVFPNPVSDEITFVFKDDNIYDYNYKIVDISGKLAKSGKLNNTINISELSKGTYFLILTFNDILNIQKLVKN